MTGFTHYVELAAAMVSNRMGGTDVQWQPIPGEVPVVQITIEGREALPLFVTQSDAQLLCICYLWTEDEIAPQHRIELLELMLGLNISIPLSAFGRVGNRYVMYGSLASDSVPEYLAQELVALSDNAVDALEAVADYLK